MTKAYIVLQRGGLQKGRVRWTRRRLLVGANSPKDALRICKQVGDKTTGYRVHYHAKKYDNQVPYGHVINTITDDDPTHGFIAYNGRIWYMDNPQHAVALGSRVNNPIVIDPSTVDFDVTHN